MDDDLLGSVGQLLRDSRSSARTQEAGAQLDALAERLEGPLRLAIAGKVKAGKSTLLNALLSEDLAATDAGECTQVVTWYRRATSPAVILHPVVGPTENRPFTRSGGTLTVDLGEHSAEQIDHLEVCWPNSRLAELVLVDTPGIASISVDVSQRTHRALTTEDNRPQAVDAVLYLLRHAHSSDMRFLESFHDDELVQGTPINTVGVLSRADEIGACRLDALDVADRVARRYEANAQLHRLCPIVLPVAGLLAFAGSTLRETEFRALAQLAALPDERRTALLLTVDRIAQAGADFDVTPLERQHLLQRLGLFGVRLSVELIRTGVTRDAASLGLELVRRSGLERLRTVLEGQFTQRSKLLKARSALIGLAVVLESGGCADADHLRARAERIVSAAHSFEEVRLLDQLRGGGLQLSADRSLELDRIVGGSGHDAARRLGLAPKAAPADVSDAAQDALERWQRIAEHPMSSRAVQLGARTAIRTLEGLLSSDSATAPDL